MLICNDFLLVFGHAIEEMVPNWKAAWFGVDLLNPKLDKTNLWV